MRTYTVLYCSSVHSLALHYLREASRYLLIPMKSNFSEPTLYFSTALSQLYDHKKHLSPSSVGLVYNFTTLSEAAKRQGKGVIAAFSSSPDSLQFPELQTATSDSCESPAIHSEGELLQSCTFLFLCLAHPWVIPFGLWKTRKLCQLHVHPPLPHPEKKWTNQTPHNKNLKETVIVSQFL